MEPDTSVEQQDDLFWDEQSQMMLRRSGVARWRAVLAERAAARAGRSEERLALRARLLRGPAAQA